MSTLQYELMKATNGLSDASLEKVIEYVRTFIVPFDRFVQTTDGVPKRREKRQIGALAGEKFLSDGYDFDAANDEIAELFEGK